MAEAVKAWRIGRNGAMSSSGGGEGNVAVHRQAAFGLFSAFGLSARQ